MAQLNRFDMPLPTLHIDTTEINIETKDNQTGSLSIKNTGGGMLKGKILSRLPGLVFTPNQWEGNKQEINYTFNAQAAGLATGQSISSHIYISSNGGEVKIPVRARLTKMSITTDHGIAIANLQDFYNYAQEYPDQARRIFVDSEFYMLLLAIGYEYMEIYESLHKDSNRERAMDNFFVLSGLKNKTHISINNTQLEFIQKPYDTQIMQGSITVKKSDNGYAETPITIQNNSLWLNCPAIRLISNDFDKNLTATVDFSIDPRKISGSYARDLITIGTATQNTAEITYRKLPPISLRLNRTALRYDDRGILQVTNNTGEDIRVEVFCPESYVRFSARSYLVGAYGEIPFEIKLSAFLSAQLFFRKLPFMKASIEVKTTAPGRSYKKSVPLTVGEW